MTELLTAAQMRSHERAAIESGQATGLELMERAGRGVVAAVFEEWPELAKAPHRAVVLCGPGNNGGDGFVVARLLKEWGWEVEPFLHGDPDRLPPDARVNYERWRALGPVAALDERAGAAARASDLVVDALFGTGLTRPVTGLDAVLQGAGGARVVSVDLPSGLCSDSGRVLAGQGAGVLPGQLTVTFHTMKPGHVLADGPWLCGKTVIADIALRPAAPDAAIARCVMPPERGGLSKAAGHKYAHGHALILSGGAGRTGAARLAARGALRIGAGLVTLGVPGSAQMEVAAQVTAIMLRRVDDADALAGVLEDTRLNALCLGPGLGLGDEQAALVAAALKGGRASVLDADALTLVARDASLFAALHEACVLTPHAGEFARLFPDIAAKLSAIPTAGPAYSRVDATRAAAERAGCVVLFKGPDTVIAAPDGRCSVNAAVYDRAAPWLATAGSGDVLAGFITGLLARGVDPMHAAEAAAWLHVDCARRFGPGLIAEDIPEALPGVLRDLGL